MSGRDWFRAVAKEVRAIAPVWTASALTMGALRAPSRPLEGVLHAIGAAAYFIGPPAVGALAFGHEFNSGTWPLLLTLPVSRRRLIGVKFGVLSVLLLCLVALAKWPTPVSGNIQVSPSTIVLPVLMGAFVAPWLTLETRRAVGGAVFPVGILGVLLIIGQIVGVKMHGYTRAADDVAFNIVRAGALATCVMGAVLGWRRFMRLEVLDGGAATARAVAQVRVSTRSTITRSSPWRSLWAKEFQLQRLTFSIAALYAATYVAGVVSMGGDASFRPIAGVLTVVYGCLIAMVAGAVASAEERQLGTLDSQLLLPIGVASQWAVKCAMALGLAVALGYGLPRVLIGLLPSVMPGAHRFQQDLVEPNLAVVTLLCAAISLYLSSVSRTTVAALVFAFPVYLLVVILFREIAFPVMQTAFHWINRPHPGPVRFITYGGPFFGVTLFLLVGVLAAFVAWLALSNHRYADRKLVRIAAHAALMVIALIAGFAVLGALGIH